MSRLPKAFLLSIVAWAATATPAVAAGKPKVGYLGADLKNVQGTGAEAVDAGATAGLESVTTVEPVPIPRAGVTRLKSGRLCASEACAGTVAGKTGAEYFIRADVRRSGQADYSIALDLIKVAPFAVVFTGEDKCTGCVAEKLGRRVELAVAALVARLVESLEEKPVIAEKPPAAAEPSAPPAAIVSSRPAREVPVAREPRWWHQRWVPWTAAATSLVALTGAIVAWRAAGDGSCSLAAMERQCPRLYDTKPLALGLGGVGVVAALGAGWAFYEQRQQGRELTISTWGTGLLVGGRF